MLDLIPPVVHTTAEDVIQTLKQKGVNIINNNIITKAVKNFHHQKNFNYATFPIIFVGNKSPMQASLVTGDAVFQIRYALPPTFL